MQTISAFSKNLGLLQEGSTANTDGELFLTVSNSFSLNSMLLNSRLMNPAQQFKSSRQNCVFSSIFSSECSSISNLLLILPISSPKVLFISSMDLNLQLLICSSEFSVNSTDSFSVCSSFFLEMQLLMTVEQLSWKSVRIFSNSSQDQSILLMRSESSSFLKSLLKALRQCSMNLVTSMESWFLCEPWMVRQMEQMRPRSLQLASMQTKVGFWPWLWQLYGLMNYLKLLENCCTSTSTDIQQYITLFTNLSKRIQQPRLISDWRCPSNSAYFLTITAAVAARLYHDQRCLMKLVYIIILTETGQMNKIYDIHSDQLKCNFCTNYFKCTLHYANLQRYSLKACEKCITNFTYTVLHPTTYQILRVMLLDIGITIPFGDEGSEVRTDEESVRHEMGLVKEEINSKISSYFEEKIRGLMKEMSRIKENIGETFQAMEKMYVEISQHNSSEKMQELRAKIERLKEYETINIIDDKGKLLLKSEKKAAHSSSLRSGKKISSSYQSKQNVSCNHQNKVAKSIKSKCGFEPESSARLMTSRSKSRVLDKTRINHSIIKSIKLDGSRKLDQSIEVSSANYEEWDRAEVSRMLEEKIVFPTYMPREVIKQANLKSEGSRNIVESVLEMKSKSAVSEELIELVGGDAAKTNFSCYLKTLKDHKEVKTVRMIRCSLVDADLDQLLNFLSDSNELQTLIITNNRLTELSIEALLAFKARHPQSRLSTVYIGNNYINSFKSAAILRRQPNNQLTIHL